MSDLAPFRGGRKLLALCLIVGIAGLLLTGVGAFLQPRRAGFSYLVAYTYWTGIAVASLGILMAFHVAHARWPVVLRRALEAMAIAVLPLILLFVPIAVGMKGLFPWISPPSGLHHATLERLHFQAWYLNVPFFLGRAALYFAIWGVVAWFLFRWSLRQDASGDPGYTAKQRRLSAGALPAVGFALTFAAYDWLMSIDLGFQTEIIGLYWTAGSVVGALALLIVASALATGEGNFGGLLNPNHFHSLGKLLLAFVAVWAWMAYSQFMLAYVANLPERIEHFVVRVHGGWGVIGGMVVAGQFALPFLALLSRSLKLKPGLLAAVAVWTLAAHYLDLYWVIMPTLNQGTPVPWFTDLTAFLGVGGIAAASAIFAVRGRHAVPLKDPYLDASLRYRP